MKKLLVLIIIFCLLPFHFVFAYTKVGTTYTTDGSYSDVNAAVVNASAGDTITIPAGTFSWGSTLSVPDKSVTIQGAGSGCSWDGYTCSPSGSTTYIVRTGAATFTIAPSSGTTIRIKDMELACGVRVNAGTGGQGAKVQDGYAVTNIKIDHVSRGSVACGNRGATEGKVGIVYAHTYGVFANIYFATPSGAGVGVLQHVPGYDVGGGCGLQPWQEEAGWGTGDFVFLEDSYLYNASNTGPFDTAVAFDGSWGGKQVIRKNYIQNWVWGNHDQADQTRHGFRAKEIADNVWKQTDSSYWSAGSGTRSGGLLVHGNRLSMGGLAGGKSSPLFVSHYLAGGQYGAWGQCDGANTNKVCVGPNLPYPFPGLESCANVLSADNTTYSCINDSDCGVGNYCVSVDSNEDVTGYVCREQIGAGKINSTTGLHAKDPAYEWDNYYCIAPGGNCTPTVSSTNMGWLVGTGSAQIVIGRDVINDTEQPGYTSYEYPHPLRDEGTTPSAMSGVMVRSGPFK